MLVDSDKNISEKKLRILLIVQPYRTDYYGHLAKAENVEWILLWYERESPSNLLPPEFPFPVSDIVYWQDFSTPKNLLGKVKPDRILFYEIIDLRQIALIVAARAAGIPTYYSDHGAAGDQASILVQVKAYTFMNSKSPYLIKRIKDGLKAILKSKYFYYSVFRGFNSMKSYMKFALLPVKMIYTGSSHNVLSKTKFIERVPQVSINFNNSTYEEYVLYTGITKEEVSMIGVPFFDKYYDTETSEEDYIVYIEHPYLEENIAGWTREHHAHIASGLFSFAEHKRVKLYIKLHPRSNKSIWDGYKFNRELVTILQEGDFTQLYKNAKLILGFSSTVLIALLGMKKNVVLLGWNPVPHVYGTNFAEIGVCHESKQVEELDKMYTYWLNHNMAKEKQSNYEAFLKKYNYPFDGKATWRMIQLLRHPERYKVPATALLENGD